MSQELRPLLMDFNGPPCRFHCSQSRSANQSICECELCQRNHRLSLHELTRTVRFDHHGTPMLLRDEPTPTKKK